MANSSILLDNEEKTEIPAAVRLAQQQGFLSMEKQPVVPVAKLFFSFDIVNSTVYKANTVNWPIIIKGLLDYIRRCVQREADLQGASLWRVIGDEMVFVYQIIDKRELYPAVDAIFRITQRVSLSIRTGKFFNTFAHNDVVFDTRFRTNKIDRQVCNAISNATNVPNLNFETITDYLVLIVYLLSLLRISKNDSKRLISSYIECTERLRKAIPANVYSQIIRTDNSSKVVALRKFI